MDYAEGTGLPLYGIDREIAAREHNKKDPYLEKQCIQYINALSGGDVLARGGSLLEGLKDGVLLCKAMNAVSPGAIRTINTKPARNQSLTHFKHLENEKNFLQTCRTVLGMREHDMFTTADLMDGKSSVNVVNGLIAFSRAAHRYGCKVPPIGPKESRQYTPTPLNKHRTPKPAQYDGVPKLNVGSAGIMERSNIDRSRDITYKHDALKNDRRSKTKSTKHAKPLKTKKSSVLPPPPPRRTTTSSTKRKPVQKTKTSSNTKSWLNSIPLWNLGSSQTMQKTSIDKSKDITFGHDAATKTRKSGRRK